MRLVYVLLSPTFGMHQYTADYANRLALTHNTHLVTTANFPADRYAPAVQVHTPLTTHNTGLSRQSLRWQQLRQVYQTILALNPDAVHFTGPHLWHVPLLYWLKRRRIYTIHTIHDLEPHTGTSPLLHLWNSAILRGADEIVVHGQRYQAQLQAKGYDAVTYLPLLHLFLGYEGMERVASGEWRVASGKRYAADSSLITHPSSLITQHSALVLFFGRLEAYKGVGDLLAAWEMLPEAARESSRLVLAGKGKLPDKWRGGLPPNVELRNRLILDDEAEQLFVDCSLLALPYWDATQSALIGAAYYFSKPVIATRTGALPEYIIEGQTGWLIPPKQPNVLAKVLAEALADPSRLSQMGLAGRHWYDKQRKQETANLLDLYQCVMNHEK